MPEPDRKRRSIRLKEYDYSQGGMYFVTVCTRHREPFFGVIERGEMQLNDAGDMLVAKWDTLPDRFPAVELDSFVVMPNHVHAILNIVANGDVGAGLVPAQRATTRVAPSVGDIVGAYKSLTTVAYTHGVRRLGWPAFHERLWQRNYYEHVIRNEESLKQIRQYIADNPARWEFDQDNPSVFGSVRKDKAQSNL